MNTIMIEGNLTKDIVLNKTSNDTVVGNNTLAVNQKNDEAMFIPITVWGKIAEEVSNHAPKGTRVLVVGELQQGSYIKDGEKITAPVSINVKEIKFLSQKKVEASSPSKEENK